MAYIILSGMNPRRSLKTKTYCI
jgi:hypothetical protein